MSKKIQSVLTVIVLLSVCLVLFTSCQTTKLDFFSNIENSLGVVGKLVRWMHSWIGNYGWTVVVFTVFLKVLMLPLDFWQRYASRKMSLNMQKMQPLLAEIDKRYGANSQRAQEEKSKLYQKQGTGLGATCLPMIVSMAIFFVMFGGLREYSNYSSVMMMKELSHTYFDTCITEFSNDSNYSADIADYNAKLEAALKDVDNDVEGNIALRIKMECVTAMVRKADDDASFKATAETATAAARKAVQDKYTADKESWLWIQNVWQPDTWEPIMASYDTGMNSFTTVVNKDTFTGGKTLYNTIRDAVLEVGGYGNNGSWNGLLILPILSIVLSFLSMFISQKLEAKHRPDQPEQAQPQTEEQKQQQASNKMMMIIMPLMMAYFGFLYTGAFAIYMVANYAISILSTIALRAPVEKAVLKKLQEQEEKDNSGKASYMR